MTYPTNLNIITKLALSALVSFGVLMLPNLTKADIVGFGTTDKSTSVNSSASNGTFEINGDACCGGTAVSISGTTVPATSTLELTGGVDGYGGGSAFDLTPQKIGLFTSTFTFSEQTASPGNYGFAFVLQDDSRGANAVDSVNPGYPSPLTPITPSFQVVFRQGTNAVGFIENSGSSNTEPFSVTGTDSGLNFADPVVANLSYDGYTLSLDLAGTSATTGLASTYSTSDAVSLTPILGGRAYVGFSDNQSGYGVIGNSISDFSYAGTPEPSVWALSMLGLGGFAMRQLLRRRRSS